MSTTVEFHWSPHEDEPFEVAADLFAAAGYLDNIRPPLAASRELIILDIKDHFAQEEGPDGEWEPIKGLSLDDLSTASYLGTDDKPGGYKRKKELAGLHTGILQATGAGYAVATSRGSFELVSSGSEGFVAFAADPPHFMMTHNRGALDRETYGGWYEGPNPLPKREWLWLSAPAMVEIEQIFDLWAEGAVQIVIGGATNAAVFNISGIGFRSIGEFFGPGAR